MAEEEEKYSGMYHVERLGIAACFSVKSGKVESEQGVFRFHQSGFGLRDNMLFCNVEFTVTFVAIGAKDIDFVFFFQPHSHWQIRRKATLTAHFKINNRISDSINSKPNVDFVSFF